MLTTRSIKSLMALVLAVVILSGIAWVISTQWALAGHEASNTAALDWYLSHDHAILDGDNNVVPSETTSVESQLAPLEWYLSHDHAIIDGDNNVVSGQTNPEDSRWAPLNWYLTHDHAILDGDNNVLNK